VIYLKNSVGIEIRRGDLLISCLRSNFAGGVFTSFVRVPGYLQRDRAEVHGEIDKFFKRDHLSRENIVLGIPRQDVIFRQLDLPKEVADNLKQVVLYQVQSFEPTEEEKLYYDFVLLSNGRAGKKLPVLLMMIRKSILESHLQIMNQLGLRPAFVTAGSVALANMFLGTQHAGRDKTFLLADLRPGGFELVMLRGGALVYAHEAARQGETPWKQLLLHEMESAVGKVRLDPEENIEGIVMAGEESESVWQEIGTEIPGCELIGGRLRFEMPPGNKTILQEAATSLGLAYMGITHRLPMKLNLLPSEYRVHQKRWAYIPTIVLGLGILVLLAGLGLHQLFQQRILIRELDQETQSLKGSVARIQSLRSQTDSLEKQILFLEELLNRRDYNLEILQELTTLLPADSFLKFYRNQDGALTIQGNSGSPPDLLPKLEKSPFLKEVKQSGAIFRDIQTGKDTFTFLAKCEK
jgi:Tfp pilus assembly protein PilN